MARKTEYTCDWCQQTTMETAIMFTLSSHRIGTSSSLDEGMRRLRFKEGYIDEEKVSGFKDSSLKPLNVDVCIDCVKRLLGWIGEKQ